MEPLFVLFVLPVLVGVASELYFRDTTHASLTATLVAPCVVFICISARDPGGTWNWLATLLVSPLAIAIALATVLICFGRLHERERDHRRRADPRAAREEQSH